MRLIKYAHACVRLERDGASLLIDPGVWAEDAAFEGVDHILVTHEHFDHLDTERLTKLAGDNPRLRVYAPEGVAESLSSHGVTASEVSAGETFQAGDFMVDAVGGEHAEIYDGLPGIANLGYVVDGVYHPGDSFFVPAQRVETLLTPVSGPWHSLATAIDFTRAVSPARAYPIHDALLSDIGTQIVDRWLDAKGGTEYARLKPAESASW